MSAAGEAPSEPLHNFLDSLGSTKNKNRPSGRLFFGADKRGGSNKLNARGGEPPARARPRCPMILLIPLGPTLKSDHFDT